ncbi:MAG: YkgJ family cysteine cluster protein [Deltaproteobacteria bacterium]|nr:YkgJ family cysteine cluster protein [Deltaproteobacteria bacterium]
MRCVGHCCRRFAIEHSEKDLHEDLARWRQDPGTSTIRDVEIIAPMVIPIARSRNGLEYVYTCKNLSPGGDCGIYETRPQMCRDFPTEQGCHFRGCKSSQSAYYGMPWWRRAVTRWKWLKSLSDSHMETRK